jgi:hypothetical protein
MTAKENSQPRWTQETILGVSRAFMESRVLLTGAELDLFTLVANTPLSAKQIAEQIGADLRALTIVVDALAAMGLLIKQGETYLTEPSAARLLAAGGPESVLPMIQHSLNLWDRWGRLTSRVVEKRPPDKPMEAFVRAMHAIATPLAPRIVALVNPGGARRLIDVGGALGTYTMAFLRAAPEMRATLFDRPPVIEMAREVIGAAGLLDRVTLVAGDFSKDTLPGGHDLAFASAVIHQNSPDENVALFRRIFAALQLGGRIVVRDHVMTPDHTQPKSGALFAVNMLSGTSGGGTYTEAEIRDALTKAGFVGVRLIQPDSRMDGLIEAFKPR